MAALADETCAALSAETKGATAAEVAELKPQVAEWTVVNDGMDKLERAYTFDSFAEALAFTDKVGAIAEAQGHHPQLPTEGGRTPVYGNGTRKGGWGP